MGLHVEGSMYAYYLYGYEVTKYNKVLTDEYLLSIGVENENCVPDFDMMYSLKIGDRLFVGYIVTYFDDMPSESEIVSLNPDDLAMNPEFIRFKETMKKISEYVGQDITIEPKIICWTEASDKKDEEEEDWNPYYVELRYILMYGYDLTNIGKKIDKEYLSKLQTEVIWECDSGDFGFPIFPDYMQIPIGGYIIDKLSLCEKYHMNDEFWKESMDIAKSTKMLKIKSVVQKICDDCEINVPELGYYALKVVLEE